MNLGSDGSVCVEEAISLSVLCLVRSGSGTSKITKLQCEVATCIA